MNNKLLAHIEQTIKKSRYGRVTFDIQIHEGEARYLVENDFSTKRYNQDGTQEAFKQFAKLVTDTQINQGTGSFSLTLNIHNGKTTEAMFQSNNKKQLLDKSM